MVITRRLLLTGAATVTATPAFAQLGNILLGPKTIIEHAANGEASPIRLKTTRSSSR